MAVNYLGYSFSDHNAFMGYVEIGQLYGLTAAVHGRLVTGTPPLVSSLKMRAGHLGPFPHLNFWNTPKGRNNFQLFFMINLGRACCR